MLTFDACTEHIVRKPFHIEDKLLKEDLAFA